MTGIGAEIEALRVRIEGVDSPLPVRLPDPTLKERRANFASFRLSQATPAVAFCQVLPHAPNRCRAVVTVNADATADVYLCGSRGDAQALAGALIPAGEPYPLTTTSEVWAASVTVDANTVIGVTSEYES